MMAHDFPIIVISYMKRSPTGVVQVMNYTHDHKELKGSDVASASEVFAHPVTPHIPERSSVDRNRSTFKVRCN